MPMLQFVAYHVGFQFIAPAVPIDYYYLDNRTESVSTATAQFVMLAFNDTPIGPNG